MSGLIHRPRHVLVCMYRKAFIEGLLAAGARVSLILSNFDLANMSPDAALLQACEHIYTVTNFNALEELGAIASDLLVRNEVIDLVFSLSEFSQYGAGYLDVLLRPGKSKPISHISVRDKRVMKRLVTERGVRAANWVSVPNPQSDDIAAEIIGRLRFPIVLKPVAGFGTMSTVRVEEAADLLAVLKSFEFESRIRGTQMIAEEFIPGRELHIDALWSDGIPLYFFASAYRQPRLATIEIRVSGDGPADGSHILPEDEYASLYASLRDMHARVNEALEISTAATHMEVFELPDGRLYFSEIGSRAGGGWAPQLLAARLGGDFWELMAKGLVTGTIPVPPREPRYIGVVHITGERPGRILQMPADEAISGTAGVIAWYRMKQIGDEVGAGHAADWCLFVVIGANTATEYDELARFIAIKLRVVVAETGGL